MSDPRAARLQQWARSEAFEAVLQALCESRPRAWREETRTKLLARNKDRLPEPAEAFRRALDRLIGGSPPPRNPNPR